VRVRIAIQNLYLAQALYAHKHVQLPPAHGQLDATDDWSVLSSFVHTCATFGDHIGWNFNLRNLELA
jgi:hypothetical protein